MNQSEVCVLVTGVAGGGIGMELIKALKMATNPYKIVVTDINKNSFGLFESPYRYLIPPANSENYIDSLIKICKNENVHAIVTGSEPELIQVSKHSKQFEEQGIKVLLNPLEIIELCSDKFKLMNFLESNNVLCPKHFLFEKDEDLKKINSYPIIIKPRIGGGSQNVFLTQDFEEAQFFSNYLKKYGHQPVIQEYLGNHDEEYTIGILYAENGKLKTSIAMKRFLGGGLSTRQTIVNQKTAKKYLISSGISQGLIDDFKEIRKMAENIASVLKACGPINIQCRKTDEGIIPFEINPRFSGTTSARSLVGYNEPDIFCRYKLFNEIPEKIEYKFGIVARGLLEKYISLDEIKNI